MQPLKENFHKTCIVEKKAEAGQRKASSIQIKRSTSNVGGPSRLSLDLNGIYTPAGQDFQTLDTIVAD